MCIDTYVHVRPRECQALEGSALSGWLCKNRRLKIGECLTLHIHHYTLQRGRKVWGGSGGVGEKGVGRLLLPTKRPSLSPGWRDCVRHPTNNPRRKRVRRTRTPVVHGTSGPHGYGGAPHSPLTVLMTSCEWAVQASR